MHATKPEPVSKRLLNNYFFFIIGMLNGLIMDLSRLKQKHKSSEYKNSTAAMRRKAGGWPSSHPPLLPFSAVLRADLRTLSITGLHLQPWEGQQD